MLYNNKMKTSNGVNTFYREITLILFFLAQVHLRSAERLRDLCCANRGTFIKVGQHLGALDYLLPEEYTSTLKVLHSRAPQSSLQEIEQVIREELGKEEEKMKKRLHLEANLVNHNAFLNTPKCAAYAQYAGVCWHFISFAYNMF
uniref:Uncharacterized protein n=1 Tax=Erpetoichthys calabaricus TaxID=27687 RepID=A0A8C4TKB0_ERPCA